ncbi:DUF411 domain-containing protein [Janibacter limosus]|jgi:hypothetical protein|uniref:DUF411 domain-containing protein n=1 Tax=Janibacter limosus TaxID=53458 RepID=UPI0008325804|nr:DUF411 domain-containing protein [Janibacter limosus]
MTTPNPRARISRRGLLLLTSAGAMSVLSACADPTGPSAGHTSLPADVTADGLDAEQLTMTVYKDESCGCCGGWVTHAEEHGFTITTKHPDSLASVWQSHDIGLDLQSCHLASNPDGHLFIGHVPARHVLEYLADPPRGARGLSVPAMPVGTPGMEQGDRFDPYSVMLITDGKPRVFARIATPADQEV